MSDGETEAPRESQRQTVAGPGSLGSQTGVLLCRPPHPPTPSILTPSGLVFQDGAGAGLLENGYTVTPAPSLPTSLDGCLWAIHSAFWALPESQYNQRQPGVGNVDLQRGLVLMDTK